MRKRRRVPYDSGRSPKKSYSGNPGDGLPGRKEGSGNRFFVGWMGIGDFRRVGSVDFLAGAVLGGRFLEGDFFARGSGFLAGFFFPFPFGFLVMDESPTQNKTRIFADPAAKSNSLLPMGMRQFKERPQESL